MANAAVSPIEICPINFKAFEELNRLTGNIEETLLLSKIKFHQTYTKLVKAGEPYIARSRAEIISWFGFSDRKTDALLSSLNQKGFIKKIVGTFYGTKKLFLNVSNKISHSPINLSLLDVLLKETGSLKAALIFAKIAFKCGNTQVVNSGISYCYLKKEALSKWAEISIRKLDSILDSLCRKGLILKKNLISCGKRQNHFHIPQSALKVIKSLFLKEKITQKEPLKHESNKTKRPTVNCKICRVEPAKMQTSIKVRANTKKTNNTTVKDLPSIKSKIQKDFSKSDIILSKMKLSSTLTEKQKRYLSSALQRTIQRHHIFVSSQKELFNQLMFTITNPKQMKGVKTFTHAVSRCMAILRSGNWKTPIGFYNHDETGRAIKDTRTEFQQNWEEVKRNEISSKGQGASLQSLINQRQKHAEKESLTHKALDVAAQVVAICKTKLDASHVKRLTDGFIHQLNELFGQGADKDKTLSWLKANMANI